MFSARKSYSITSYRVIQTHNNVHKKTDHMPVISVNDITLMTNILKPRLNFRLTDLKEFNKALQSKLDAMPNPDEITTVDIFNQRFEVLDKAIRETIKEHIPMSKPCPYSK